MKPEQLPLIATIWGIFGVLAVMAMIFAGANTLLIGILAASSVMVTGFIISGGDSSQAHRESGEKAKNHYSASDGSGSTASSSSSTAALLELLDEEDLRELRQRIKRRVIDSIETSSDGELSTLDALLAEQQLQKRR